MDIEHEIKRKLKNIKQTKWDNIFTLLAEVNNNEDIKSQFIEAIYDNGFIYPFDWVNWEEGMNFIKQEQKNHEEKDLMFLIQLLTVHIRKDRFNEGWLDQMLNDKTIFHILTAIKNKL